MGRNCCPLKARAMTWGKSWGSNTSNEGAHQCSSPTLLPCVKEKAVLLMADETTDLHRVGKIWQREEDQGRKMVRCWRKAQHQSCQYPVASSVPFGCFGFLHNMLMHTRTCTNYSPCHNNPQSEGDRKCDLTFSTLGFNANSSSTFLLKLERKPGWRGLWALAGWDLGSPPTPCLLP